MSDESSSDYSLMESSDNSFGKKFCVICLDNYDKNKQTRLKCFHCFHYSCIYDTNDKLHLKFCPLCRKKIDNHKNNKNHDTKINALNHNITQSITDAIDSLSLKSTNNRLDEMSNMLLGEILWPFVNNLELREIDMSWNDFEKIPKEIETFQKSLQILHLSPNKIKIIPNEIGCFIKLERLMLGNNKIEQISKNIGLLINLKYLNMAYNEIKEVPKEIGNLINLLVLDLSNNRIEEIPKEIGQLINLQELDLSANHISKIKFFFKKNICFEIFNSEKQTKETGKFPNLNRLNLSENRITKIPKKIGNLTNLIILDLSNNSYITKIPKEIIKLTNLKKIYLPDNNLKIPKGINRQLIEDDENIRTIIRNYRRNRFNLIVERG